MADHTIPEADRADELEQHQPADRPEDGIDDLADHGEAPKRSEHSLADPVPEADAIEQHQPLPDPDGNDPGSLDPG